MGLAWRLIRHEESRGISAIEWRPEIENKFPACRVFGAEYGAVYVRKKTPLELVLYVALLLLAGF